MTEDAGCVVARPETETTERHLLEAYRREKLELADCLLAAVHLAESRKDGESARALRELTVRLAEDRFQLAVVGQFSRGKSTLMNAILGDAYLPTGALPMTSVITTVVYGSEARATVRRREGLAIETPINDLERFVAQHSEEREELGVLSALVELPAEILRLGFCFVDTPGVGSAITANTATTVDFLPHADAVVFVTSLDSPITEAELSFLAEVRRQVHGRIFVVLNKTDLVASLDEQRAVAEFVQERLGSIGLTDVDPFLLSARAGLTARQTADAEGFAASGVGRFQAALTTYLTREKSREFLLGVAERCERFVAALELESRIATQVVADETVREKLEGVLRTLVRTATAERLRQLHALQERVPMLLDELTSRFVPGWRDEAVQFMETRMPPLRAHRFVTRTALRTALRGLDDQTAPLLDEARERAFDEWVRKVESSCQSDLLALSSLAAALENEAVRSLSPHDRVDSRQLADPPTLRKLWPAKEAGRQPSVRATTFRRAQRVLTEVARQRVDAQVVLLQDRAHESLASWISDIDGWSATILTEAVERVRCRLSTAPSPSLAGEFSLLRSHLAGIRARVTTWSTPNAGDGELCAPRVLAPAENELRGAGCVVCEGLVGSLFRFMAHYQFELATQLERRESHAAGNGFCPTHTWYYAEIGSPVGISASYARLGEEIANLMLDASTRSTTAELRSLLTSLHPTREVCPACRCLDQKEAELLAELRGTLPKLRRPTGVPPLCIDHAAALIDASVSTETARAVTYATAQRLLRRAEDMRTYALKREALRRSLLDKDETVAYRDVLLRLASDPLLAGAPRRESELASPFRRRASASR